MSYTGNTDIPIHWWDGCHVQYDGVEHISDFDRPWFRSPNPDENRDGQLYWTYWIVMDHINPHVKIAIDGNNDQIIVTALAGGYQTGIFNATVYYSTPGGGWTRSRSISIPINGVSTCTSPQLTVPDYVQQHNYVIGGDEVLYEVPSFGISPSECTVQYYAYSRPRTGGIVITASGQGATFGPKWTSR